ncbi:MAG: radical SAM protein [Anaerolineae bacterium]
MKETTNFPQIFWDSGCERAEQDCACSADVPSVGVSAAPEPRAETDCACAPAVASIYGGLPASGLWSLPPSLYRAPLPDGHLLAFNPTGPAGVVVLNGPAAWVLDSFAAPAPLTDPTAHQLAALGLLAPTHTTESPTRNTPHAFTFHVLTLWLHLTTRCNLRCAYCYAPRGQADMPPEVGRAAVDGAIRSATTHGFRALKLKYAGGEPTLNLPTLRAVHRYARARTAEAGLELREVVLTNGTVLTPGLLEWLRDEGIRLAVSLDGLGPAHDGQRASDDGGSFARVAAGIEQALALGLHPHLSVTVTACNVDGLAEVAAFALDRGLPFNLNFVRPAPGRPDLTPEPERLIAGLRAALAEMEQRLQSASGNWPSAICHLLDRCDFSAPHRYPCGAGHAYLVVSPEGRLARCHMEMERTIGTVWEEDPLAAVRTQDGFRNPPVEEKEECRECPWRSICAGGCPLMAQWHRGTPAAPSPYCAVYRAVLPDLLRLEGLRMMRAHSTS